MGCSPPDWWYREQHAASIAADRREHQRRVNQMLSDIEKMSDEEKTDFKKFLGLDK